MKKPRFIFWLLPALIFLPTHSWATGKDRVPQFPLKTERRLYTEGDLATARGNIDRYSTAKAIAQSEIARASDWLSWSDEELASLIAEATVPRAFNVGTNGCPLCGKRIYEKGGTYPWIIDPKNPFQVKCPVDGAVFPSNDFKAFYQSGGKDRSLLSGDYPDDGWGWVGPDGHRYWFVAYANHWTLENHILPAVRYLARAYLLTGDTQFAHKALVLLHRIADVYPDLDYHTQSRYGQLQAAQGARYEGKFVNLIWETSVLYMLAEAYDCVWDFVDKDEVLQSRLGKTGEEIRAFIEANLLEEGIDCIFAGKIRGNYGMHQKALTYAALARDEGPVEEWLGTILRGVSDNPLFLGLEYSLYNLIYRDGVPYETSPGYNFSWIRNITEIGETLKKAGIDIYDYPRTRQLYEGVLDVVAIGKHTPALGDASNVYGGLVGQDPYTYQAAWRAYRDPRYLNFLAMMKKTGENSFSQFESLFHEAIPEATGEETLPPQPSRLLDGYGMGILNNEKDTISVSCYYGYKGGHGHFDRLHFDLFANGWPIMPDTGYPDFMNAYVPGIYSWSKNTIAHNTVMVDRQRQTDNVAGQVTAFVDTPRARVMEIDASGTYPQCSEYRRTLLMVDLDEDHSYLVDVFKVKGGNSHHYSLHGPPGEFELVSGEWTDRAPGTLAGATVEVGALYDDPIRSASGFDGTYYGYSGSGFQHFTKVRRLKSGHCVAHWVHEKDPNAHLRIWIPEQEGQGILTAQAQVSPITHKQILNYLIASREGEDVESTFVSVIEPSSSSSLIEGVSRQDLETHVVLKISQPGGVEDTVRVPLDPQPQDSLVEVHRASPGHPASLLLNVHPDSAHQGEGIPLLQPSFEKEVLAVHPSRGSISLKAGPEEGIDEDLIGRVLHFQNDLHRTAYTVKAATVEGNQVLLETDVNPLVGRLKVGSIEGQTVHSKTPFEFGPTYKGCYLTDAEFSYYLPIAKGDGHSVQLVDSIPENLSIEPDQDLWVVDIAPGDRVWAPAARCSRSEESWGTSQKGVE